MDAHPNMKVILYSAYSDKIAELADITYPSNRRYAEKHGYDFRADKMTQDANDGPETILQLLDNYDVVLSHGADVLIMNHRTRVTEVMRPNDSVVMAREMIGWWPINNDVAIWHNTTMTRWLLRKIIDAAEEWQGYEMLAQQYIWNLIQEDPRAHDAIRLVHPKEMNAVHPDGPARWQLGDWIIHFLGYPLREKIILATKYLPLAGDPVFRAIKR